MYDIELKNELERRWSSVREELARQQADALLVTTNVNLYYVSGRVFAGMAYIPNEGEPLFFVRRPVGLKGENVLYIRKPEEMSDRLRERGISLPRKLLLETDSIPMSEYLRYEKIFSPEQTGNGTRLLRTVRSVKTPFELGRLRLSGRLHAEVYRRIPELFRPGMTDLELSVEIERESRLKGSRGIFRIFGQSMEIFGGSVLAGDNAGGLDTSLPVGANGTVLSNGMSVMVDMGGNFTGYMTDMTRVFSVSKLPDLAYRAHDTSLEIQRRIAEAARPGTPASELYAIAVHTAAEAGLSEYFMGHRQQAGFVGHGIGIEINEMPVLAPRSKEILAEGMVFALEPKFVIPGVGAVGIENSFAVTAGGLEKLTPMDEEIVPLA